MLRQRGGPLPGNRQPIAPPASFTPASERARPTPSRRRHIPYDHLAFFAFCLVFLVTAFSQIST
ncbi:hypothetical protein DIE23_32145 [Burkholderia sp. Bp9143]|nr:hypothetical protein DIE23_32145 [Burkholderia sp. Bp9143]